MYISESSRTDKYENKQYAKEPFLESFEVGSP